MNYLANTVAQTNTNFFGIFETVGEFITFLVIAFMLVCALLIYLDNNGKGGS